MGKDFEKELSALDLIYRTAQEEDVRVIVDYLLRYYGKLFWGIGSGGSYSVARIFEYLCVRTGWTAKSLTPLELSLYDVQIKRNAAILFTASGRNADSKNSYQYLSELEPEGLLTCCMHKDAPLKLRQKNNLHNFYFEYKMPVAKDGYLAVESLISSLVLLCKAFECASGNPFFHLPSQYSWRSCKLESSLLKEILSKESLILLHGGITTPVAIDLESKFCEASLGNIQLADFRNFAHGRHYWLSDRKNSTAIITLAGASEKDLVERMLPLLPAEIPVMRLDVDDQSIRGMLDAFDFAFELVLQAGFFRNTNPGRPKIDVFGRDLYHLNYNICKRAENLSRRTSALKMAVYRKKGDSSGICGDQHFTAGEEYHRELVSSQYQGLIFDYDGTLHDKRKNSIIEDTIFEKINTFLEHGVRLGIATGRGKSVRKELQGVIRKEYWRDVVIAYYNGGCIGTLDDESQPDKNAIPIPPEFYTVLDYIKSKNLAEHIQIDGVQDRNPYQLSILLNDYRKRFYINQIIVFCREVKGLKVLASSHSVDIIPAFSSKNNLFSYWKSQGYTATDFLVMGDAGQPGGNDYELLSENLGLSVDYVSDVPDACWNFAKPGMRNLEATMYYLSKIVLKDNGFILRGLL